MGFLYIGKMFTVIVKMVYSFREVLTNISVKVLRNNGKMFMDLG